MGYVDYESCEVYLGTGGTSAPVVYVIDSPEIPFDFASVANGRYASIARVYVRNWNDSLTPWPAQSLYRGEEAFGGNAAVTLDELCCEVVPALERDKNLNPCKRAICGYSLAGLFSLYAFTHANCFDACACLSGSVWYEGWVDHLESLNLDLHNTYAFLSVGLKEKRAPLEILRSVQDNMQRCSQILGDRGCHVDYVVGPGGHMSMYRERLDAGLTALDGFLSR